MPRISRWCLHPWWVIVPGAALLCAAAPASPRPAHPASAHVAMQPAAAVAQAQAVPRLASTGLLPAQAGHPAPATGARPAASTPANQPPPGMPARAILLSDPVWATAHILYADVLGTCIACTSTQAGDNRSGSEARSSRVLGRPAAEGQGPPNGQRGADLVALPPNPLLHLALESWRADTTATRSGSSGHAEAAVLDVGLAPPGLLDVTVGRASSDSQFSRRSMPSAASREDGVVAVAGGGALRVVLLHSETSNRGDGSAQLASVNGIDPLESANGVLPDEIMVEDTASLRFLHADGYGAAAASARDRRSHGVVGLNSGETGGPGDGPAEPLR